MAADVNKSFAASLGHLNRLSVVIPPEVAAEYWPHNPDNPHAVCPHAVWKINCKDQVPLNTAAGRRPNLRSHVPFDEPPVRLVRLPTRHPIRRALRLAILSVSQRIYRYRGGGCDAYRPRASGLRWPDVPVTRTPGPRLAGVRSEGVVPETRSRSKCRETLFRFGDHRTWGTPERLGDASYLGKAGDGDHNQRQ